MTKGETKSLKRGTGLLVIEVCNSNPNGDPDAESDPRTRWDKRGEISPVSFKRKLRDLVDERQGPVWQELSNRLSLSEDHFHILEKRKRRRDEIWALINESIDKFHYRYWDARVFGNTFLEKQKGEFDQDSEAAEGKGKKKSESGSKNKQEGSEHLRTGVVQFGLGLSVAPIEIGRSTLTNKPGVQEGKDRGMAPLGFRIVQHGVYLMPFFVNSTAAKRTNCDSKDLELLLNLIPYAYSHTASMIRNDVRIQHAWYMEHISPLGSCADWELINALSPKKKDSPDRPSISWGDYDVPTSLPDRLRTRLADFRDLMGTLWSDAAA